MWTYSQSTGFLSHDGVYVATGYAGSGTGKNNPAYQYTPEVGPLPTGLYTIGAPVTDASTGPYTLPLTPDIRNNMQGRSGFKIHGDSRLSPGNGSHGCIVLPFETRQTIWNSGDYALTVV